jgi:threonine/homoserine/homoserine lactone efflux protein
MNIIEFAGEVVLLSASGVLSPGPLFFANLIYGSKQGYHAGFKIAYGHTIVELPLLIFLASGIFGLSVFTHGNGTIRIVGLIGGIAIILFSATQIGSSIKKRRAAGDITNNNLHLNGRTIHFFSKKINGRFVRGPLLVGIVFSALNPFFLIWWLTVGLKLISDSVNLFGIVEGVFILYLFHIWMDYVWLVITAYLISKGQSILKLRFYYLSIICISIVLVSYGCYLLVANIL